MKDDFERFSDTLTSPATAAQPIVPSDTEELAHATRGLFVGQSGDATVKMLSGDVTTLKNLQAGTIYPIRICQVLATGTTASGR